jgi:hypothetical protein
LGGIVKTEEGIRLDRSWCRPKELRRVLDSQSDRQTPGSPQIGRGEEGEKGKEKRVSTKRRGGGGEYKEEEIESLSPGGCGKEKKKRSEWKAELRQKEKLCGTVMTGFPGGG